MSALSTWRERVYLLRSWWYWSVVAPDGSLVRSRPHHSKTGATAGLVAWRRHRRLSEDSA